MSARESLSSRTAPPRARACVTSRRRRISLKSLGLPKRNIPRSTYAETRPIDASRINRSVYLLGRRLVNFDLADTIFSAESARRISPSLPPFSFFFSQARARARRRHALLISRTVNVNETPSTRSQLSRSFIKTHYRHTDLARSFEPHDADPD